MFIDPKPEYMLHYLFDVLWKIPIIKRDHFHNDPINWVDEPKKGRMIRTHCKVCGDFIGYRPFSKR
jgi:hypothetical protein